ncbi:MAG TPA: flagellar assembly peptidoglycan hydrolase FlgJ [Rhodocyclaceae bacterium]|nr:flagellar assembly peptidoglycan hydrolase FlgJ [Rhodocyclaceae bacterium]HNC80685.1 flagellar assembly peptidoglycan hydrolase FlgJ [Rhodocyclaceae bacterium]
MAADFSQINALDPRTLGNLQRLAKENSPEAAREAAKQFEGLFLQQVLKSMRDASPKNGLFDSEESRMYQGMLDQQLALQLASRGGGVGLAKVIERQLGVGRATADTAGGAPSLDTAIRRSYDAALPAGSAANAAAKSAASAASAPASGLDLPAGAGPRAFVERIWPDAVEASRATGIPARFFVAQAALETGWGKYELKNADGSPSYNLFNIKAGRRWSGDTVSTTTVEYANGTPTRESARFRRYGSYAESFRDYAAMLANNPRYAAVMGQSDASGFARALQSAGYATDPQYADKLTRIIQGNTLRTALAASASRNA